MIIARNELGEIRQKHSQDRLALRFGCYDLLHAEHQKSLEAAKSSADILVVGVMPDEYVRNKKGIRRPVNPEGYRVQKIDEEPGVDYSLIVEPGIVAMAGLFVKLKPDVYIEHEEHGESLLKSAFLRGIGVEYVIDRMPKSMSTTEIIATLGGEEAIRGENLPGLDEGRL